MREALRELYWAIKTLHLANGWSFLKYFYWRMDRIKKLPTNKRK